MTTTEDLAGLSRADLLARCQAEGMKATAWKKERMLEELLKLGKPADEQAAEEPGPPADEKPNEPGPPGGPSAPPRRCGWCNGAPMWSMHHEGCRKRRDRHECACPCRAEGWERPPYPEGAQLSKFNPDRPRGEFG